MVYSYNNNIICIVLIFRSQSTLLSKHFYLQNQKLLYNNPCLIVIMKHIYIIYTSTQQAALQKETNSISRPLSYIRSIMEASRSNRNDCRRGASGALFPIIRALSDLQIITSSYPLSIQCFLFVFQLQGTTVLTKQSLIPQLINE